MRRSVRRQPRLAEQPAGRRSHCPAAACIFRSGRFERSSTCFIPRHRFSSPSGEAKPRRHGDDGGGHVRRAGDLRSAAGCQGVAE